MTNSMLAIASLRGFRARHLDHRRSKVHPDSTDDARRQRPRDTFQDRRLRQSPVMFSASARSAVARSARRSASSTGVYAHALCEYVGRRGEALADFVKVRRFGSHRMLACLIYLRACCHASAEHASACLILTFCSTGRSQEKTAQSCPLKLIEYQHDEFISHFSR